MDWTRKKVLVTGCASLISSHLCDALLARNVKSLAGIDNLSSGKFENIKDIVNAGKKATKLKNM